MWEVETIREAIGERVRVERDQVDVADLKLPELVRVVEPVIDERIVEIVLNLRAVEPCPAEVMVAERDVDRHTWAIIRLTWRRRRPLLEVCVRKVDLVGELLIHRALGACVVDVITEHHETITAPCAVAARLRARRDLILSHIRLAGVSH